MADENVVIEGQAGEVKETPQVTDQVIDGEVVEILDATEEGIKTEKPKAAVNLKDAWRQVENLGQTLGEALQGRGNVVMVRVNDDALQHLDMLVEAEMTKSRSESAAFLINEGIKSNAALFDRIREITEQITQLRAQLREAMNLNQE